MKNISIFCGAHRGKDPQYTEAAKIVAECIAKKGINVVFGGVNVGLMKVISDGVIGEVYNIGGGRYSNCSILEDLESILFWLPK